jgi:hypothetical protein
MLLLDYSVMAMRAMAPMLACSLNMAASVKGSTCEAHLDLAKNEDGLQGRRCEDLNPVKSLSHLLLISSTPVFRWHTHGNSVVAALSDASFNVKRTMSMNRATFLRTLHLCTPYYHKRGRSMSLQMLDDSRDCNSDAEFKEDGQLSSADRVRIERARLQERYDRGVRARRPAFLPFVSARQWARAMHFTKEADWREWIENGEKRNAYIPSNPDEIYAQKGWAGWYDFLNGDIEDLAMLFDPKYKRGRWLK